MILHCKLCEYKIPIPDLGLDWWCPTCRQYSVSFTDNGIVEFEAVRFGNFYLTFFPAFKTASIASTEDVNKKILKSFDMNELTHEQAVQWVNKLKLYVTFQ